MKRITIIELNKDFNIPESWDELTDEQVLFVFREYYAARQYREMGVFWSRLLDCFLFGKTKITSGSVRRWSPYSLELAEVLFAFLFKVTGNGLEINFKETKNYLPVLQFKKLFGTAIYNGPKDNISNLTFDAYDAANMYLNEYFSGDSESIYKFIACLYRPPLKDHFIEDDLDIHSNAFKNNCKEFWKIEMIMLWYCNCVRQIQTEDIYYNGNIVNFSCLFGGKNEKEDERKEKNKLGWLPVLRDFAEKGIFGNLQATKQANLYDLLAVMLDKYNENQQLKKEYEKIGRKH